MLNTQIKHPILHNSHPDKMILEPKCHVLQSHTQITTLLKVRAHANIDGNEQADKLAKRGCKLDHNIAIEAYVHAHPPPTTSKKSGGTLCLKHQTKAHRKTYAQIDHRHLEKHILKYDKNHNLGLLADPTHQIYKWLGNTNINKELSNDLCKNSAITNKQRTYHIKFQIG